MARRALCAAWLLCGVASAVIAADPESEPLETRWQALLANCTAVAIPIASLGSVSVPAATTALETLALDKAGRSRWLHDLGEWNLLYGGNVTRAEEFLRASAGIGNPQAQFLVGALVATDELRSPAEATLFYGFASLGGSIQASMALGYRNLIGYNAPRSCETALRHYKSVADDVMRRKHALPNGDLPIQVFSIPAPARLSDDQSKQPHTNENELREVDFLRHRAATSKNSDLLERTASVILFSDLYQKGTSSHKRVRREAVEMLHRAVRLGSGSANAMLGHVYAYGLAGVNADVFKAVELYQAAINASNLTKGFKFGRSEAANGLGRLYLHGARGIRVDVERAMSNFQVAAHAGHAEGVFHTATVMAHANPSKHVEYLEASAHAGHVGALFELARVKEKDRFRSAPGLTGWEDSTKLYKRVAEHNVYGRGLLARAAELYLLGRYNMALRLYLIAAEMGYEVGEHNAMWLMERFIFAYPTDILTNRMYHWLIERSKSQGSADAVVRDGTREYAKHNYRRAMQQYLHAIDLDPTHAMALYNAGYMCEHGLGTVTSGKSLLRAGWYYKQALLNEPLLKYVVSFVVFKIDVELKLSQWIRGVTDAVLYMVGKLIDTTVPSTQPNGKIIIDQKISPPSDKHVVAFEPAMGFNGKTSSITITTTVPGQMEGLTLETWMWIEQPSGENRDPEVVLEWQNTLRVELARHKDRVSWQLRLVSADPVYASVLTLTDVALQSQRWYHIIVAADETTRSVRLLANDELEDRGNFLLSLPTRPGPQIFHVGIASPPASGETSFHGKLVSLRLWAKITGNGARNSLSQSKLLWVDLGFSVSPTVGQTTGTESDRSRVVDLRQSDSELISTKDVNLHMVQVPFRRNEG